ncbi:LysM peptidoglycan-binding domain-containing protein [Rhodocytophaga rosea]|uniref:LysM peptidoglycan-binding domain-containing protein n=1 Tax=Rhodocytophaga rosea TaxID=2704465 RepID=A0A6C0GK95_9BACT|nr:LysM peptidoglycan-binding domain-containing protein [Rhodocytophaga rosea]QHT68367.1 LysM peptidoglycan-binding domain-containing protein [Rhodocytophaga rosea]
MGLLDFLKNGDEKKATPQPKAAPQAKTPPPAQPQPQVNPVNTNTTPPASSAAKYEMYTVKEGDWLSKIAGAYYGDVHKWDRIFQANRDQISDPDKIRPGQILKIPLD